MLEKYLANCVKKLMLEKCLANCVKNMMLEKKPGELHEKTDVG